MRTFVFAGRTTKEMLRDPLNLFFGIGFPVILLLLLTAIQKNVPEEIFLLDSLTPGIAVFGFSFLSLFSATLISKDRTSSFLARLFTTPLKASDYIIGYTLPLVPMAVAQMIILYIAAFILGLEFNVYAIFSMLISILSSLFFIAFGLLCGSVFTDKQVGGLCGALLTNLTAWLSGTWFSLDLVGGAFKKIAELLPFYHAVEMGRAVISGSFENVFPHIFWVLGYAFAMFVCAAFVFSKKMRKI